MFMYVLVMLKLAFGFFNPLNVLFCLTEMGIYLIPGAKQ